MSISLTRRLQAVQAAHKSTVSLIEQLQSFDPSSSSSTISDSDRLDLSSQIHDSLKEQEDTLALLRQELDDGNDPSSNSNGNNKSNSNTYNKTHRRAPSEREQNADLEARLTEDIKTARGRFRRAQLQAKKRVDDAKRREREALFRRKDPTTSASSTTAGGTGGTQERLTADELAKNASEDVTRALRRAHDLLSANLTQSQFAQQTLDESQSALKELSQSYGGTTDLLKASRGLVGQLVRSNKSDTWYLQTAFYVITITIAWLVFRRWMYGPLWWLVYLPLRLGWKGITAVFSVVFGSVFAPSAAVAATSGTAISGAATTAAAPRSSRSGFPVNPSGVRFRSMELPAKGAGWGGPAHPEPQPSYSSSSPSSYPSSKTILDEIGKMAESASASASQTNPLEPEDSGIHEKPDRDPQKQQQQQQQQQQQGQEQEQRPTPRNTLKRMMEVDFDSDHGHDEL